MTHRLAPVLYPQSVVFVGGSNLEPTLRFQHEMGFAGQTWVVNPKYDEIAGFPCLKSLDDLPGAPDLAYVAIRRDAAIDAIRALRDKGCKGVICGAAGFAEAGLAGADLQQQLVEAAGDMPLLGPNTAGLANFAAPVAAMIDNLGVRRANRGIAIASQGGGLLEDALFCDRDLRITHVVGGGNQAVTGIEEFVDFFVDDPHVTAIGLSFEALRDVNVLRRAAARSIEVGKPIVALKFGVTSAGAHVSASHTGSMASDGAMWEALLDRLGIIMTRSTSEFFETLKLIDSGQMPKGRRIMVVSGSGLQSVLAADHFSGAGFELPQPSGPRIDKLRELLPVMATPCNPQDLTGGVWLDFERCASIYSTLLDEECDAVVMVQNHPRANSEHTYEYTKQVAALSGACTGRDIAAIQVSPMTDCFPAPAREHSRNLGVAAMQGLEECTKAISHVVWWQQRRSELLDAGGASLVIGQQVPPAEGQFYNEASAKALLAGAGVSVPESRVTPPCDAADAADALGYPVVVKALDARLQHKTEVGAVRIGLESATAVQNAVIEMRSDMERLAPEIPLASVLVETMVQNVVVELMASVTYDLAVGMVMLVACGGTEAEIWNDRSLIAAPFSRFEIRRGLEQLKSAPLLHGWRGRPSCDLESLLDTLEALGRFAIDSGAEEIEINPILLGPKGVTAVDAILKLSH